MKKEFWSITLIICLAAVAYAANNTCPTCGGNTITAPADKQAGKITVEKTAPEKIIKGETLKVLITITNTYPMDMSVSLNEYFGGAEEINLYGFKRSTPQVSSVPPVYKETVNLPKNSQTTVYYEIKPLYYGPFMIPETELSTSTGTILSNPLTVSVECNQNKICEPKLDENALTCPQDCSPDKPDGLCNPIRDGICDPDCPSGADPDCVATTTTSTIRVTSTTPKYRCGDKICQYPEENYTNCPQDCPSGGKDGYCDKAKDGRCDPDCAAGEDADCAGPSNIGLIITALFVLALILIIAYKKRWLKKGD